MSIIKMFKLFKWFYRIERTQRYTFLFWAINRDHNVFGYYDPYYKKCYALIDNYPLKGNTYSAKLILKVTI